MWLFSRRIDLLAFGAPAIIGLLVAAAAARLGLEETPTSLWLFFVVGVDVSHVWSTGFRAYAGPSTISNRWLALGIPLAAYLFGVALHLGGGALLFWRVLAYVAVFHFIRQQYGWVRLYRKRGGETGRVGAAIDAAAIYLATLYPLVFWHTHLPRHFDWFLAGDFLRGLPAWLEPVTRGLYLASLAAYLVRAVAQARSSSTSWGKHLLVGTTAACWHVGIVALDSDLAFTATNVLIHGVPYFVLVFLEAKRRTAIDDSLPARVLRLGWPAFYLVLLAIAFCEEGLWDRLVWHDHPHLFGASAFTLSPLALSLLVPLLALPQLTHYVLDAFIWRTSTDPALAQRLDLVPASN